MGRAASLSPQQGPIGTLSLRFESNEESNEEREGRDLLLKNGEQDADSMFFAKDVFEQSSGGKEDKHGTGRDMLL